MPQVFETVFKVIAPLSFFFHFGLILLGGIGLSAKWDIKLYYGIFSFTIITMGVYTILLPQAFESDRFEFQVFDYFLFNHAS